MWEQECAVPRGLWGTQVSCCTGIWTRNFPHHPRLVTHQANGEGKWQKILQTGPPFKPARGLEGQEERHRHRSGKVSTIVVRMSWSRHLNPVFYIFKKLKHVCAIHSRPLPCLLWGINRRYVQYKDFPLLLIQPHPSKNGISSFKKHVSPSQLLLCVYFTPRNRSGSPLRESGLTLSGARRRTLIEGLLHRYQVTSPYLIALREEILCPFSRWEGWALWMGGLCQHHCSGSR